MICGSSMHPTTDKAIWSGSGITYTNMRFAMTVSITSFDRPPHSFSYADSFCTFLASRIFSQKSSVVVNRAIDTKASTSALDSVAPKKSSTPVAPIKILSFHTPFFILQLLSEQIHSGNIYSTEKSESLFKARSFCFLNYASV